MDCGDEELAWQETFAALDTEADEVGLSSLGWQISNLHARLISGSDGGEGFMHEVAASFQIRFCPDDWVVRFDGSFDGEILSVPRILWQLRSRSRGSLMSYDDLIIGPDPRRLRAPKMVSSTTSFWYDNGEGLPDDLYLWVGGVDWAPGIWWDSEPSLDWRDVPCEIVNYMTRPGIAVDVKEGSARVRDGKSLEVSVHAIHPLGSADELLAAAIDSGFFSPELIDEPVGFFVPGPDVIVDVFDGRGFLLESREVHPSLRWVRLSDDRVVPMRSPSFIAVEKFMLADFAGDLGRIRIRFQDSVE